MRYRESLNRSLHELMSTDKRVFLLGEDIADPYGGAFKVTKGLSTRFPDRVISTPISEAGIVGFAIGMAMGGLRPIVEIMFGDFITLCVDQIVNHATKLRWMYKEQVSVPLVVRTPMGGRRGYGPTHSQSLESMFMSTPFLKIVSPSHFHDCGLLLASAVTQANDPVLFVENKLLYGISLDLPAALQEVKHWKYQTLCHADPLCPTVCVTMLSEGMPDVSMICYGGMAPVCVEAARLLMFQEEIAAQVVIVSSVKPLPMADLVVAGMSNRIVVAEEGCRTGGWGAEVASLLSSELFDRLAAPILRIGTPDCPIPSAPGLEAVALPQAESIARSVADLCRRHK